MSKVHRIIFSINIFFLILTLLSYLSPYIDPNSFWPISMLGLAYPILLIANGIFILFWVLVKPKLAIASILVLGIGWKSLYNLYALPTQTEEINLEKSIKVMSYNIAQLNKIYALPQEKRPPVFERFKSFISEEDPDIFCFQEMSKKHLDQVRNLISGDLYIHQNRNTGILSRYPITKNGIIKDEDNQTISVWVEIDRQEGPLRIYSIYLQSNNITRDTDQLIGGVDLQQQETWRSIKRILSKYRSATQTRAKDIRKLKEHITSSELPVIVCGDFNDVPQSFVYHEISTDLFDTFHLSRGLNSTYGGKIPFLRIDYILTDPIFSAGTFRRELVDFSDHYPLITTLAPRNKKNEPED